MVNLAKSYPATLEVDYPKKLDRLTTFFRIFWSIPALILLILLTGGYSGHFEHGAGKEVVFNTGGIMAGLFAATVLMIVFRQRYPRWWFNFALELNRFAARAGAYMFLLTDKYPSTEDEQSVHLNIAYPNVRKDLNRWLPLIKWLLALPHYIVLFFLTVAAVAATIIAWFAILITGQYPRSLFDFVVGVGRWNLRVSAYAILLVTDKYPPFSLK
jgi:hypothetical protein